MDGFLALAASPFLVLSLACVIRFVMLTVLASREEPDPDRLFISPGTVKNHLKSLFRKTESQNRADLVRTLLVGEKRLSQA